MKMSKNFKTVLENFQLQRGWVLVGILGTDLLRDSQIWSMDLHLVSFINQVIMDTKSFTQSMNPNLMVSHKKFVLSTSQRTWVPSDIFNLLEISKDSRLSKVIANQLDMILK